MGEARKILANFNENTIRVYQAYNNEIADEAIRLGTFGSAFKLERMTWIKPSFLWMMYRAGWGTKKDQERIMAIDIKRRGFEEMLKNAVLSTFNSKVYASHDDWKRELKISKVRCQWDPDRDIYCNPIGRRAIQLGISGDMVRKYVKEWIVDIFDITNDVHLWHNDIRNRNFNLGELPKEEIHPVSEEIRKILGM